MTDLIDPPSAAVPPDDAEGMAVEPVTQWDLFITRLRRHRLAMISAIILLVVMLVSFPYAWIAKCDKNAVTCDVGGSPGALSLKLLIAAAVTALFVYGARTAQLNRLLRLGGLVAIWVVAIWVARGDLPQLWDFTQGLVDDNGRRLVNIEPRSGLIFGTDEIGRDVLSRVVHGGQASLTVGLVTGLLVASLGTVVGSLAGYYPGIVDQALMRFTDLILGLPLLPVAIVVGRLLPELPFLPGWMKSGPWGIAFLLGFLLWGSLARIVRAEFLSLREKEFVEAARAAGANDRRIIFRHILPNAMSPIIVQTTLIIGTAIIIEAALSFLGFGVRPPTPTWGAMAASGAGVAVRGFWWELVFAGAALVSTVLAVNFIGDGLRDALDPTQTIERR